MTPFIGSTAQTPITLTGTPPATSLDGQRPGLVELVHVQGPGGQRSGLGPVSAASNAVTPQAPLAPGAPTGVVAGGADQRRASLDGAERRRAHDHHLHGHPVRGRRRADAHDGHRLAGADVRGRPGPHQRHVLHVHGAATNRSAPAAVGGLDAVTPSPAPRFIQRTSGRVDGVATLQLRPVRRRHRRPDGRDGRRVVVRRADDLRGHRLRREHLHEGDERRRVRADRAQRLDSPDHRGRRHAADDHADATGDADIGGAALEYAGLSTAAGTAAVDVSKTATGTSTTTASVTPVRPRR